MEIEFGQGVKDDQVVVFPQGALDLYASISFFNSVLTRFDRVTNHLVLDFSRVRYIDSSGVGALIRLAQYANTIAGEIQLAGLTGTPKKILEMSNLIRLFKVSTDVESALRAWD